MTTEEGKRVDDFIRRKIRPHMTVTPEQSAEEKAAGDWLRRAAGLQPEKGTDDGSI